MSKSFVLALAVSGLLAGCATQQAPTQPGPESAPPQTEMGGLETRSAASTSSPAAAHHVHGTTGMKSLQHALAAKGYYHGRIDGRDGPQTKKAVARYQQDLGVTPTGEVDDQTWSSLGLSEGN